MKILMIIIKLYIFVAKYFYLIKGRRTEIHFKDLINFNNNIDEINTTYAYTHIYSIIQGYLMTTKNEIISDIIDKLDSYMD